MIGRQKKEVFILLKSSKENFKDGELFKVGLRKWVGVD